MRLTHIKRDPKVIETRKYNHFDSTAFLTDLKAAPFNEISRFTNSPSEMWTIWKTLYLDILNKHATVTKINIKGQVRSKKSLAQMREREKCKTTSHHCPQCAKWFSRYHILKSGI